MNATRGVVVVPLSYSSSYRPDVLVLRRGGSRSRWRGEEIPCRVHELHPVVCHNGCRILTRAASKLLLLLGIDKAVYVVAYHHIGLYPDAYSVEYRRSPEKVDARGVMI